MSRKIGRSGVAAAAVMMWCLTVMTGERQKGWRGAVGNSRWRVEMRVVECKVRCEG